MSKLYIVGPPHSDKLWNTSWFYECIPYESNTYLVNEERVIDLFGKHHRFKEHNERFERLHENYGHYPNQLRIEFDEE